MYEFRLTIELPNGKRAASCFRVDSVMTDRVLRPMDICTDNLTAMMVAGKTLQQAERIKADREGLARDISKRLTLAILKVIEEQDTVNGYPAKEELKQ